MKRLTWTFISLTLVITLALNLSSCASKEPVCHIASDISLIIPNQTSKAEILSYLGPPAQKKSLPNNEEEWLYFQSYNSLLRTVPLVGKKMGDCQFDLAIIKFKGDIVSSSQYRDLTEAEFKQLGVPEIAPE